MKTLYNIFLLLYCFIIMVFTLLLCSVFSFFTDAEESDSIITTGSVNVIIDNVQVEKNNYNVTKLNSINFGKSKRLNGGLLTLNTITPFKFTIKNIGNSKVEYSLSIGINFDEVLSESGKFLIYPYNIGDDDIYYDVNNEIFEYAIIGLNISDLKEISGTSGLTLGILEFLDYETLDCTPLIGDNTIATYKDYQYKLFFYEDEELKAQSELFEGKNIELSIIVNADINGMESNWKETIKSFLEFKCSTNKLCPIIEEIAQPKTFYVSQADSINLADYAIAVDSLDGVITDNIVVTSVPAFNPNKAGVYKITYNVANSMGKSAIPLDVFLVVWNFIKIESGNYHTLALTSHGKVYSWGFNYYGQLGDGTTNYNATPKLVQGLDNIIDITAGTGCSFALDADGQTYSWGRNDNGRLGDGTTTARYRPIKVSQPAGVKFVQISARFDNVGGVTADGDVYTWGYAGYGASGNGSTSENRIPTKINLSNIAHLEMGYYNGAAITKDGELYTWGDNYHGQLGNGQSMAIGTNAPAIVSYFRNQQIKIKGISVGWYHMIAVTEDGNIYTWGYGNEGRLGNGLTGDKNTPQLISVDGIVEKAIAAYFHTGVMTTDGRVYFFGQNYYGKHGTGNSTNHLTPILLNAVINVQDITLAYDSSFVLTDSGVVYGMGYGGTGILGTGNSNNSNIPVKWMFTPPDPY